MSMKNKCQYLSFNRVICYCIIILSVPHYTRGHESQTQKELHTVDSTSVQYEVAIFAGGCFWCMQPPFDQLQGVVRTRVGYTGGTIPDPTYEQVCSGETDHVEAVEIIFDPMVISYETLLDVFWRNIDPTTTNRQFADSGTQYQTAIFYLSEAQKRLAEQSKTSLQNNKKYTKPLVTLIRSATQFYPAEEYHQNYYKKNMHRYQSYKKGSGRADYIKRIWESPSSE